MNYRDKPTYLVTPHGNGMAALQLPPFLLPIAAVLFLFLGTGANTLLGALSVIVLLWGCAMVWRPGEAPILVFVFLFQWLQASIAVYHANLTGLSLEQYLTEQSQSTEIATVLSLIGLMFLTSGIRLGSGQPNAKFSAWARQTARDMSYSRWAIFYAVAWISATACQALAIVWPGLSQGLLALANLKWAAYIVFTIATFIHPAGNRGIWLAAFGLEFLLSIGGYFSSFKDVFIFTIIALAATGLRLSVQKAIGGGLILVVMLGLGVIWTAIKSDFRTFASGGETEQVVVVTFGDRIAKLTELIGDLQPERVEKAAGNMIRRISYVEFFGSVIDHVPRYEPYADGALWFDALTRPLMPRIFFPNKAIADDSATTVKYAGVNVAGYDEGTSISIGYMGETYADFGMFFMFLPILGLGYVVGRIYRWLLHNPGVGPLVGMSLAASVLKSCSQLETTITKTIGGLAISTIVCWLLVRFILPQFLPRLRPPPG